MKKLDSQLKKTKTPDSSFAAAQTQMKETVMNAYDTKHSRPSIFTARAKRSALSLAAVGVIAVGVVGSGVISGGLTSQQVLAQAQENIQKQNEGRYVKSVMKSVATFEGQTEEFTITNWADTESENHRSVVTDKDGTVINTMVYKDGKLYVSESQGFIIGAEDAESGEIIPDEDGAGESVFFGTDEEFEEFVANNDVEVLDITDEELLDGEDGFIEIDEGAAVEVVGGPSEKIFERLDKIQSENDPSSRLEQLQKLAQDDGATLSENTEWEGFTAHKVTVEDFSMYFSVDTLDYIGSEQTINEPGFEASFKDVIVEESYSNDPIDLSTDGLEEVDDPIEIIE